MRINTMLHSTPSKAELVVHRPPPPPTPPATYDLIGLSEDEMGVIAALIGRVTSDDFDAYPLYQKLGGAPTTFDAYIRDDVTYGRLKVRRLGK